MATNYTQFKGFKKVFTTNTSYSGASHGDFFYFVRENGSDVEGQIWFQGMCYGSCRDSEIDKINTALAGFLEGREETGYTNVKEYIDAAIAQVESDVTTIEKADGSFSGLTISEDTSTSGKLDYTISLVNVAPADELTQEIADRKAADEALENKLEATAQTLSQAIKAEEQAREAADDELDAKIDAVSAATETAIEAEEDAREAADDALKALIDELSGSTDDLQAEVDRIETAAGFSTGGSYVADDGQFISAATSVLDATAKLNDALVKEIADRNQAIENAIDTLIGDATESGNTLGELEDRIEELSADAKEYHLVKIENGLPATIKERYELQDASGNTCGTTIDITKDSHIVSIRYITDTADTHYQNLEYTYIDVCGATKTEYVDMSQLVLETEFACGVTVTNGVAHGVVDPASETFLTVGADGFKLSGVQDAIDTAVDAEEEARKEADSAITEDLETTAATLAQMIEDAKKAATTKVVEGTDEGENMEIVPTTGADGSVTYRINLTDVASASALTAEETARQNADAELQALIDALESGLTKEISDRQEADEEIIGDATASGNTLGKLEDRIEVLENESDELAQAVSEHYSEYTAYTEATNTRLNKIEHEYITAVTVNGVDATVADNAADVTIGSEDIAASVTGNTSISGDTVDEVLQEIVDALNGAIAGSYTGATSSDGSISLGWNNPEHLGQNLSVNVKELADADVEAGETEIKKDANGALYGVMYWIDEETE